VAAKRREEWCRGSNFHPIILGQLRVPKRAGLGPSQVLSVVYEGLRNPRRKGLGLWGKKGS